MRYSKQALVVMFKKNTYLLTLIIVTICSLSLSIDTYILFNDALSAINYPFELDYGEGAILNQLKNLLSGNGLYVSLDQPPYVITNYPPLYHYTTFLFNLMTDNLLMAGRIVSFSSTCFTAVIISYATWLLITFNCRRVICTPFLSSIIIMCSIFSAISFLAVDYVYMWAALMRVDMLAVALSLTGFTLFLKQKKKNHSSWFPLIFFVLSVFTKQSMLAAPMAVALYLLVNDKKAFKAYLKQAGVISLITLIIGLFYFERSFFDNLVTANKNEFRWNDVLSYFSLMWRYLWLYILCSIFFVLYSFLASKKKEYKYFSIYITFAFLFSLSIGKVGSNFNYFIEYIALCSITVGVCLYYAIAKIKTIKPLPQLIISFLFLIMLFTFNYNKYNNNFSLNYRSQRVAMGERDIRHEIATIKNKEKITAILEQLQGPVLSEDMTLLAKSGHSLYFQPFVMTQLSKQGIWDQSPLIENLLDKKIPAVLTMFDVELPYDYAKQRFTDEFLSAVQSKYYKAHSIGNYYIYMPRTDVPEHGLDKSFTSNGSALNMGPLKKALLVDGILNWKGLSVLDYQGKDHYAMTLSLKEGRYTFSILNNNKFKSKVNSLIQETKNNEFFMDISENGVYQIIVNRIFNEYYIHLERTNLLLVNYQDSSGNWSRSLMPLDRDEEGIEIWYLEASEQTFYNKVELNEYKICNQNNT